MSIGRSRCDWWLQITTAGRSNVSPSLLSIVAVAPGNFRVSEAHIHLSILWKRSFLASLFLPTLKYSHAKGVNTHIDQKAK